MMLPEGNTGAGGETENRRELIERFWTGVLAVADGRGIRKTHCKPHGYPWLASMSHLPGISWNYLIGPDCGAVEVCINHTSREGNGAVIDALFTRRDACEKRFGAPLIWECLEEMQASRIRHMIDAGGFRSHEYRWAEIQGEMVTRMAALESAIGPMLEEFTS